MAEIAYNEVSNKLNCSSRALLAIFRNLEKAGVITPKPLSANYLTKSNN